MIVSLFPNDSLEMGAVFTVDPRKRNDEPNWIGKA